MVQPKVIDSVLPLDELPEFVVHPNSGLELRGKDGSKVRLGYFNPEGLVVFLLVLLF